MKLLVALLLCIVASILANVAAGSGLHRSTVEEQGSRLLLQQRPLEAHCCTMGACFDDAMLCALIHRHVVELAGGTSVPGAGRGRVQGAREDQDEMWDLLLKLLDSYEESPPKKRGGFLGRMRNTNDGGDEDAEDEGGIEEPRIKNAETIESAGQLLPPRQQQQQQRRGKREWCCIGDIFCFRHCSKDDRRRKRRSMDTDTEIGTAETDAQMMTMATKKPQRNSPALYSLLNEAEGKTKTVEKVAPPPSRVAQHDNNAVTRQQQPQRQKRCCLGDIFCMHNQFCSRHRAQRKMGRRSFFR